VHILLAALIGQFYEAATDETLWNGITARIAAVFDSSSAVVKLQGPGHFQLVETTENLQVPEKLRSWAEDWHLRDLWVERSAALGLNRIVTSDELVTREEQQRSGYYQDWLRHLQIHHMVGAVFPAGDDMLGVLGVHRPESAGAYTDSDRQAMAVLLPHLQRAMQLGQRLAKAKRLEATNLAALDHLDSGVLTLDATGKILYINAEAAKILRESQEIYTVAGRLAGRRPGLHDRLSAVLQSALETAHGRQATAPATLLVTRSERLPLTLSAAPLRLGEQTRFGPVQPKVMVFLRDPERTLRTDHLRELFGMTTTEAAIAAELAVGRGLEAIAARHQIGVGTVRWHLKQILLKTGTNRQSQTVALLARSVATLASQS
jgi:DNA-binding CsgD family transcriptional regulator/PAS domain-containing protein